MKKNLSSLNFSFSLYNHYNNNYRQYETTYKSAYGNFCNENYNFFLGTKNNVSKSQCIYLNQTKNNIPNSKLICPNCINENIVKIKSKSRIKRISKNNNYFEDKMRTVYENKRKKEIKNREERAKMTYSSLFKNRGESYQNYQNIKINNNKNNEEKEYFGNDIEYGMLRCRNRELKNDKKLFGIDLNIRLKNNKSWLGNNYLLDKMEYSEIINRQIKDNNIKNKNEKIVKLKEENKLLYEQLQNEKNRIKQEKENKNNIKVEMNRVNSALLREKKIKENKQTNQKRKEKDYLNKLCQTEIEEFIQNLRTKKMRNKNIDEDNYRSVKIKNAKNKIKINKSFYGLPLKGIENRKCEECKREYPKNVMSQIYYSYNIQQKK